ncbi:hypothetical protein Glove_300g54 [Diversispora epigaea]|uniref:CCHC-type domain-containing protein n=1 Tax=Diversispora epigaea TaxID=1348612 RepID=A0A397I1I3_9GLOM|nr:hypothetical protein Glove_300g54 [Diversispora epigaea]
MKCTCHRNSRNGTLYSTLNESTHQCTCLLLVNKGLVCWHFFCIGTYFQYVTFHISIIPNRWYLNSDIEPNDLLQKYPFILVYGVAESESSMEFEKSINFEHFFSIRTNSYSSQQLEVTIERSDCIHGIIWTIKETQLIDYAIKANLGQELSNKFKTLIYEAQNKSQETEIHYLACNPAVIKHKGQPPKRLKAGIEKDAHKEKQVLKNSTNVSNNNTESVTTNINGRKCGNCKQYGHYAKTCPNIG